ncbi:fungal-specific transcription factor domain-containing protein [Aspergillus floccosus]
MINRLEENIERMEDRLQELGFDLGGDNLDIPQVQRGDQHPLDMSSGWPPCDDYPTEDPCIGPEHPRHSTATNRDAPSVADDQFKHLENTVPETLSFFVPRGLVNSACLRGMNIISDEGREWINQQMSSGCASTFSDFVQCDGDVESAGFMDGMFPSAVYCPVPPKREALKLLEDYFECFHLLCPIFQRSKLLSLFHGSELQYNSQTPSRWTCINVVLALGHMRPGRLNGNVQHDHKQSWMYMKNALGTVNQLYLSPPDLWAMQGLLGMVIFFIGKGSPRLCEFLVSTAINMSQQMGLERSERGHHLSEEEAEERRRVFWIAYCMDREVSLRFGKPLSQNDENVDVTAEGIGLEQQQEPGFDAFSAICQLAVIRGRLYKNLYSARATDNSLNELVTAVGMLDEELQRWNESIPLRHRPECPARPPGAPSPMSPWVLYLHYAYYNCIIAIHSVTADQMSKLVGTQERDFPSLPGAPSNHRVFLSASLCAKAARASINLMRHMPEENALLAGFLIHYPIVASTALSWCIMRNPREIYLTYDEKLIAKVETFLSSGSSSIPNDIITHLMKFCQKCRLIAEAAIRTS